MASGPPPGVAAAASSELKLRTLSSIVMGVVALATLWLGGWAFAALWLAAAVAVAFEWTAMTRIRPDALRWVAVAGLAVVVVAHLGGLGALAVTAIGVAAAAILAAAAAASRDRVWALAGFAYAAAIVLAPVLLRERPGLGVAAILWMFAVVWTTDITAYFVGRALGGPKLWPAVSPKKTWSGFTGGLAGGTMAGWAVAAVSANHGTALPIGLAAVVALSALASVASQGGDLAESAMKRFFDVKDSGRLIPGHGGVMDRLDGFAAVAILVAIALAGESLVGRPGTP